MDTNEKKVTVHVPDSKSNKESNEKIGGLINCINVTITFSPEKGGEREARADNIGSQKCHLEISGQWFDDLWRIAERDPANISSTLWKLLKIGITVVNLDEPGAKLMLKRLGLPEQSLRFLLS